MLLFDKDTDITTDRHDKRKEPLTKNSAGEFSGITHEWVKEFTIKGLPEHIKTKQTNKTQQVYFVLSKECNRQECNRIPCV